MKRCAQTTVGVADCQVPDSLEAAAELAPVPTVPQDPAIERQQTRAVKLLPRRKWEHQSHDSGALGEYVDIKFGELKPNFFAQKNVNKSSKISPNSPKTHKPQ